MNFGTERVAGSDFVLATRCLRKPRWANRENRRQLTWSSWRRPHDRPPDGTQYRSIGEVLVRGRRSPAASGDRLVPRRLLDSRHSHRSRSDRSSPAESGCVSRASMADTDIGERRCLYWLFGGCKLALLTLIRSTRLNRAWNVCRAGDPRSALIDRGAHPGIEVWSCRVPRPSQQCWRQVNVDRSGPFPVDRRPHRDHTAETAVAHER